MCGEKGVPKWTLGTRVKKARTGSCGFPGLLFTSGVVMLKAAMSAQEMIAELPQLSAEERKRVAKALRDLEMEARETANSGQAKPGRRAGLHPGAMVMSDDFDDPLPDSFWLGEDA